MYLAEVRLINWRSYQDVTLTFPPPGEDRSLVLVGAMNGHGKTSLLFGLYFGLFGRFGTRYIEGFELAGEDVGRQHYRRALKELRRRNTDADDPTEVHIELQPSSRDPEDMVRFRIERRWFFASTGGLREHGEEVAVYLDDVPQPIDDVDDATRLIEEHLFPARVLPAFFFDGEQAQKRIDETGNAQMHQAVEVLFGTKLLEELQTQLTRYVGQRRSELPRLNGSEDDGQIDLLRSSRDVLQGQLSTVQERLRALEDEKATTLTEVENLQAQLSSLGVSSHKKLDRLAERLHKARAHMDGQDEQLRQLAGEIALPLALCRFELALEKQLQAERLREDWEALREGTQSRIGEVLDRAFPEPDPLLDGVVANELVESLKGRFRTAIESIYQPPPEGCPPCQ